MAASPGLPRKTRIPQTWVVGNVELCVAELTRFIRESGFTDIVTWAVTPEMRSEQMAASLERFAREVVPRLKATTNDRLARHA